MPHKTCATLAADVYVLALVCVMNSVVEFFGKHLLLPLADTSRLSF
jgi:hypothetical protein